MKVIVLYRFDSEQARPVLEFTREYESRTGRDLAHYDIETREGSDLAKLYDVTQYPAVIALTEDGQMLHLWQGQQLPLINEVSYYNQSN
ncbi:hypothetical protein KBB76_01315 [Candidatus Saccharibacteria bacterium]|jgi:hypothetical protein|nr:hypothetical protein [Candidatus Saccharibacteria bacterium]HOR23173.1 hypothetical protein [Candidatus Saccharibacteria bacterium]HPW48095.1 hypothetical protein [Candidatus Saccharibacteria bacterium]